MGKIEIEQNPQVLVYGAVGGTRTTQPFAWTAKLYQLELLPHFVTTITERSQDVNQKNIFPKSLHLLATML